MPGTPKKPPPLKEKKATTPTKTKTAAKKPTAATKPTTAKPAAKKPPAKGKAPSIAPDPILAARYDAELSRYRRARDNEMEGWDERYEALGEIIENKLYLAAGFASDAAFLAAEAPDVDTRTVKTYMRVARHFDPADEAKYGVSRLDALLDYLQATGGLGDAVKVHAERQKVRVPSAKSKALRAVAFPETTVVELRAAVRVARGAAKHTGKTASPAEKALRALLAKGGVRAVGVRVRGDVCDLTSVPLAKLAKLGAALVTAQIKPGS